MEKLDNETSDWKFRIINTKLPLYFEFSANPNKISFSTEKVFQETRTSGGYIFEHWGKKPTKLSIEGKILKAGYDDNGNPIFEDARFPSELFKLKQIFELDKKNFTSIFSDKTNKFTNNFPISDTFITYKLGIYSGFFTSFSYDEDGMSPYFNNYKLEFLITNSAEDLLRDTVLNLPGGVASTLSGITLSSGLI